MTDGHFARFLGTLGHRVRETSSGYWYDANRLFLLGIPSHALRTPSQQEVSALLRQCPALGVRFTTPTEAPGKLSYQIVCDDRDFCLESLSANVRSKVRRGLRRCAIEPVAPALVATDGRVAHDDTLARQGRDGLLSGERWERFWGAVAETPGMEVWGARTDGTLAAFLVTVQLGDRVEFLLARSRTDCLNAYPNNALIYRVTHEMLVRRGAREVTFGIEALEDVGPLDEFKFSMGFRRKPLKQRIVFHPLLAATMRHRTVRSLFRQWSERTGGRGVFWRKAAGLLRFAEEAGL